MTHQTIGEISLAHSPLHSWHLWARLCFNLEVLDDTKASSTKSLIIKARGCGWNTSSEWMTTVCHTGCFRVYGVWGETSRLTVQAQQ